MVVTTHHYRANLSFSYKLVECKTDIASAFRILIKNTSLCTYYEFVLLRISDPDPVVSVLTASVRVDNFHSSLVCCIKVFRLSGQAYPSEWAISIVKEDWSHDVFNVGRPNESIFVIVSVLGNFLNACVIHSLHEGIAVIEEISSSLCKSFDCVIVSM